jgi:hypothetical protein
MSSKKKLRIQYKYIGFTYNNCFEVSLPDIKAFFIDLFKYHYKNNNIEYLLIAKNKVENETKVLLVLEKKPNWNSLNKFIYLNEIPLIKNIESPQSLHDELLNDKNNQYLEYGELLKSSNISFAKPKEQENDFEEFITNLRTIFNNDKEMTTNDATRLIYEFLDETKNSKRYNSLTQIKRIIAQYFLRPIDPTKNWHIHPIETFKHENQDIKNIKELILKQLKELKKPGGRPKSIVIEGCTRIGKTNFIVSFLKSLNVKFNLQKGDLSFSRKRYSDDALVDIWDDLNIFEIRNKNLIQSIFTCSQASQIIKSPDKFENERELNKNHLSIFLCNGHSSFKRFVNNTKNDDLKKYFDLNTEFYDISSEDNLYISDEEQEQRKKTIYNNAIKPNENRETLTNVAMKLFGKDKTEVID